MLHDFLNPKDDFPEEDFSVWEAFPAGVFADVDKEVWRSGDVRVWGSSFTLCWLRDGCATPPPRTPPSLTLPPCWVDEQAHYCGADIETGGQYIFSVDSQQRESPPGRLQPQVM